MHVGLGLNMISPFPRASQSEQPAREKQQKHSREEEEENTLKHTLINTGTHSQAHKPTKTHTPVLPPVH